MKTHPVANLFPMLADGELADLAADIKANGLRLPIVTWQGQIIDGRNRLAACKLAGVEPQTVDFTGADPVKYIVSTNLKRRHLSDGQRGALAVELEPWFAEPAKGRQLAGLKQGTKRPVPASGPERETGDARDQAAALAGTSGRTLSRCKTVKEADPDAFDQIKAGTLTPTAAIRNIRRKAVSANLDSTAAREAKPLNGRFDVLVVDPPWPIEKIERDERPNQTGLDYPTMTLEQITSLDLPAADDCHLWLWTTHRFLPAAFDILAAWRFKYVCAFVWHKPGGFQPYNLPQYNCEFALYARRGSPAFVTTKAFPVCFTAPRGKHSEKPPEFYDFVRRVTEGKRLDMFNRRPIEGFKGWGKEAA